MPKTILLVEDSPDDALFCQKVMEKLVANRIVVVGNGREAITYLAGIGEYADRQRFPIPDVVLLDLKLPLVDGFGVLDWLKTQSVVSPLVVVLSHYGQMQEINRAYQMGAATFLTKPLKQEDVLHLVTHFSQYLDRRPE